MTKAVIKRKEDNIRLLIEIQLKKIIPLYIFFAVIFCGIGIFMLAATFSNLMQDSEDYVVAIVGGIVFIVIGLAYFPLIKWLSTKRFHALHQRSFGFVDSVVAEVEFDRLMINIKENGDRSSSTTTVPYDYFSSAYYYKGALVLFNSAGLAQFIIEQRNITEGSIEEIIDIFTEYCGPSFVRGKYERRTDGTNS